MSSRASRWVAWCLVGLFGGLGVSVALALSAGFTVADLVAVARTKGLTLEVGSVERGLGSDRLRDVRLRLQGGAVVRASEAHLRRGLFAMPSLTVPEARLTLTGTPTESHAQALELRELGELGELRLHVGRLSVDYRHRDAGSLAFEGITVRGEGEPWKLRADTLRLGSASWSDVAFAVGRARRTLEVTLGADPAALPRATATYVPSDGRASEWRVLIPHQPLGGFAAAAGLGIAPHDARARIGGTLSWITPEAPERGPRGSFRFVLDGWPRPPWPEAAALTGSSGSLAAVLVPSPDSGGFRLERVEIAAALFELRGAGSITAGKTMSGSIQASGRRTCGELASSLPPSRHRELVRGFLGDGADPKGAAPGGRAAEFVELSLRLELFGGSGGAPGFYWRLTPGCGLEPFPATGPAGG